VYPTGGKHYESGLWQLQPFRAEEGVQRSPTKRLVENLCTREAGLLEIQHALPTAFQFAATVVAGALVRTGMIRCTRPM
jgi:hypothetical protein